MKALLDSQVKTITIFGKSWDFHVKEALKISLSENLDIIYNSVSHLKKHAETVFYDAEHFFDGYKDNPKYTLKCLQAAQEAGADCLVLCDTNGGTLPDDLKRIIGEIKKNIHISIGIHAHNDSECAVANSIISVVSGASHVQGTINGIGERCGNANLCSIIPNLQIKLGMKCLDDQQLRRMRDVSRFVNEIANSRHFKRQSFVGDSAFAHKAGMHVSAVRKRPETYEHIRPDLVGNCRRVLIQTWLAEATYLRKAEEFGIRLDPGSPDSRVLVTTLKNLENEGFQIRGG